MPFNVLVVHCLKGHSFTEDGKTVRMSAEGHEQLAFFHLDNDAFRVKFGLVGKPVCDILVYYREGTDNPSLIFVELKGSDFKHALDQVLCTSETLCPLIRKHCTLQPTIGLIVASGSSPPSQKELQKTASKRGLILKFATGVAKGGKVNVRDYL